MRKRETDLLVRGQFNVLLNALFAALVLLSVVIRPLLITIVSLFTRGATRLVVFFLFNKKCNRVPYHFRAYFKVFYLLIGAYSHKKLSKACGFKLILHANNNS